MLQPSRPTGARSARLLAGVAVVALFAGCSNDTGGSATGDPASGWARPTEPGATTAVVYITRSDLDDHLVSASVPATIAATAHPAGAAVDQAQSDGHIGHLDHPDDGSGDAAAGGEGELVILDGLAAPLANGQGFVVRVELASGTIQPIPVTVRPNAP